MTFTTAGDSVERIATYCRVEQLSFSLLGGWVAGVEAPAAKLALLAAADHCAWRSRRWFEMLPTAPPGPDAYLTPTTIERDAFDGVADLDGAGARLSLAFEELLPALRAAMRLHLDRTTEVADAPVRRLLRISITDVSDDLDAAAGALDQVFALPGERDAADRLRAQRTGSGASFDHIFGA